MRLAIFAVILFFSLFLRSSIALSQPVEKKAEIKVNVINTVIQYLDKSNLPHQDVLKLIEILKTAKIIPPKEEVPKVKEPSKADVKK